MKFEAFSESTQDVGRTRRMAIGYVAALTILAGLLVCGAVFGGQIRGKVLEPEVDVKFVKKPEPAKPPPPPPPPPPRPAVKVAAKTAPALGNAEAPPKEIPKELPKEGDPNHPQAPVQHYDGTGDPNGARGGTGKGPAGIPSAAPSVEPSTAPSAPPAPPETALEAMTPPEAISKPLPAYPEEARKASAEAIIILRFYVEVDGSVSNVEIVRGDPMFDEAAKRAVLAWRFRPGTIAGAPTRMRRVTKIPFKLRTQ